jgi:putative transposase
MRYKRIFVKGGTYFFTVNLAERQRTLLTDHADILRSVMRKVKARHPFAIDAIVILPDHIHALWTLPKDDCDYPARWMLIKTGFSRQIPKGESVSRSRMSKGERGIWQRRYWEHLIRDENDFARHTDYIHYNPVKHGYVSRPSDWQFSSIHRYIADGRLNPDWAARFSENDVGWGEARTPTKNG